MQFADKLLNLNIETCIFCKAALKQCVLRKVLYKQTSIELNKLLITANITEMCLLNNI